MDKREQGFEEEIRKKLSQAPADFDEAAWEKMEQKLSGGERGKRRILPLWWLRGVAALVILGLGIWGYTSFFQRQGSTGKQPADQYTRQELPEAGEPRDDLKGERSVPGQSTAEKEKTAEKGKIAATENGGDLLPETSRTLAGAAEPRLEEPITEAGLELQMSALSVETRPVAGPVTKWPLNSALLTARQDDPSGTVPESEPEKSKVSFSLGVLAAPDLNAVKSFDQGKVGFNTGLSLGVHFNDRLSLHTGIVYSKKPYDARPADYQTSRPVPDLLSIAANCDVIDIPLNLQYAFYRKGFSSISLNAGLSSYLMLKEKYNYEYQSYDSRVYEYKNENRHFMGVANVGVVFERKLNDRMSIGLQPFIKVPLTGIGHGNVKLISTGAAIQLNLNMNKK